MGNSDYSTKDSYFEATSSAVQSYAFDLIDEGVARDIAIQSALEKMAAELTTREKDAITQEILSVHEATRRIQEATEKPIPPEIRHRKIHKIIK